MLGAAAFGGCGSSEAPESALVPPEGRSRAAAGNPGGSRPWTNSLRAAIEGVSAEAMPIRPTAAAAAPSNRSAAGRRIRFTSRAYSGELRATGCCRREHETIKEAQNPLTVPEATSIERAASIMVTRGFRHLPIVDGERIIGIVSLRDLVRSVVRAYPEYENDAEDDGE
jgi:CBS domain protein